MGRGEAGPDAVARLFEADGGVFATAPAEIARRLERVRALVFDWDGVFHEGRKGPGAPSGFAEPDSMGVNLLRFALWRRDGRLPVAAIVTGQADPAAAELAGRERFHALYVEVLDKAAALKHLREAQSLAPDEVAVVFDDVNDLGMAAESGVRILVARPGGPLTRRHALERGLADYVTGGDAKRHAVRETAELLLGLMGAFEAVARSRVAFDDTYRGYLAERSAIVTSRFAWRDGRIELAAGP